jgi:hypothetical protein
VVVLRARMMGEVGEPEAVLDGPGRQNWQAGVRVCAKGDVMLGLGGTGTPAPAAMAQSVAGC